MTPSNLLFLLALACGDEDPGTQTQDTSVQDTDDRDTGDSADDTGDSGDTGQGAVDADGDGVTAELDCDDNDPERSPLLPEVCDGKDNDCDGVLSESEMDHTGDGVLDCEPVTCDATGMSWGQGERNEDLGTTSVSCHAGDYSCDAYHGDAQCSDLQPVLCVHGEGSRKNPGGHSNWSGADTNITDPISGCQLDSHEAADALCAGTFGDGWVMADFHMGGGWSFWGYGEWETDARFLVSIDSQYANCWD